MKIFTRYYGARNISYSFLRQIRGVCKVHLDSEQSIWSMAYPLKRTERLYPHATYKRNSLSGRLEIIPATGEESQVRWSSITDPCQRGALPAEVVPIHITLQAGETLYLPVGWWHYVRQSGLTVALNWWYDAELRGTSWVLLSFLRNPGSTILPGNTDDLADD